MSEEPFTCPGCGSLVLVEAPILLVPIKVPVSRDEGMAVGRPFGSTFPIPRNARVSCNSSGSCRWKGRVKDLVTR